MLRSVVVGTLAHSFCFLFVLGLVLALGGTIIMGAKGSKDLNKEQIKLYQEQFGVSKSEIKKL